MDNTSPGPSGDSRVNHRVGDALLVSYSISEDIRPEFTETYDIGPGGLAMLTNAKLPPNIEVIIELELRGDVRPKLRIDGSVRWSTFDDLLGKYRTGVAFVRRSEEQERELLLYIDTIARLRDLGVL